MSDNTITITDIREQLESEKQRHDDVVQRELDQHEENVLEIIDDAPGVRDFIEKRNDVKGKVDTVVTARNAFKQTIYETMNAIAPRKRTCITQENRWGRENGVTIRDGKVYQYGASRSLRLNDMVKRWGLVEDWFEENTDDDEYSVVQTIREQFNRLNERFDVDDAGNGNYALSRGLKFVIEESGGGNHACVKIRYGDLRVHTGQWNSPERLWGIETTGDNVTSDRNIDRVERVVEHNDALMSALESAGDEIEDLVEAYDDASETITDEAATHLMAEKL